MVQIYTFSYIGLYTADKLEFAVLFEVNLTFGSREIFFFFSVGKFGPPPPFEG